MKLKSVDRTSLTERIRKHNFLYYSPFESAISEYSGLLRDKNEDKHYSFNKDRTKMYRVMNELNIEDFKYYFNEFVVKYELKKTE